MPTPSVIINIADNQVGIRGPIGQGTTLAIIAPANAGTYNTPAKYARIADVEAEFDTGPLVEMAAYAIERYGKPVLLVRCETANIATYTALVADDGASTSVPTLVSPAVANDEHEVYIEIVTGGTIAADGITYKWSLDGGRTMSNELELGTAAFIIVPNSGGARINFAAGTLLTGNSYAWRTTPPMWDVTQLDASFAVLKVTAHKFRPIWVFGALDATAISAIQASIGLILATKKHVFVVGQLRGPTIGETDAQFQTAAAAIVASVDMRRLALCGGYCEALSSITRYRAHRSATFAVAARFAAVGPHIDIAAIGLGPCPGIRLLDDNQNPVTQWHDEHINPGLDDFRLITLKTDEEYPGVFVTNPRLMGAPGTDFKYVQHLNVTDIACEVVNKEMKRRLSVGLRLDPTTGFILEAEAVEVENSVAMAMKKRLVKPGPFVSSVAFILRRDDNILSTETIRGTVRILPLAYPKQAVIEVGLVNAAKAA